MPFPDASHEPHSGDAAMLENTRRINTPLTIMGMFAVLTEVSSSVVLPALPPELQSVFVWFVMGFPSALLLLFFLVLLIRPQAIYAPADFRDDEHFLRAIFPASPLEREVKVRARIEELADTVERSCAVASAAGSAPKEPVGEEALREEARSRYSLAEERSLNRIALELGLPVMRNMRFDTGEGGHVFDGLVRQPERVTGIEVLYVQEPVMAEEAFERALGAVSGDVARMGEGASGRFSLVLAVVLEREPGDRDALAGRLRAMAAGASFPVEVKVFGMDALEEELAAAALRMR
ncbi:hypothetical protein [Chlorobium sp. N1]|uniref:hypothetical protein n=1 Tax=Chlorobium sp. N1 TaxID=2491138 RepID=UPI0010DCE3EE|nr:hypothetical protein [Chlorobium sp. N1]TCD46832.1 hypothetical protein E0L29_11220 [Chlorobium sp. N1]